MTQQAKHTQDKLEPILDFDGRHGYFPLMSPTGSQDDNGRVLVASVWGGRGHDLDRETAKANAARLAHCWNCHDELVEMLEVLLLPHMGDQRIADERKARAILAKATGKAA